MKRFAFIFIVGLLACLAFSATAEAKHAKRYDKKETTADMSATKKVFLGWVDMHPADWGAYGYSSLEDWSDVIHRVNRDFQGSCRTQALGGLGVVGAKDSKDEKGASGVVLVDQWDTATGPMDVSSGDPTGQDLYVKFSDVRVDPQTYFVYLSIHFIDPKTNSEVGSIPVRPYSGRLASTFERYIRTALDNVCEKIKVEVAAPGSKK
ncbi:MAG TPA: hypothetical protein VFO39_02625 [Candidatus Sulfotelmatobacter sp.]|nr:hypothetical protein [Candidatus Sulfotelmatobacter sp.]